MGLQEPIPVIWDYGKVAHTCPGQTATDVDHLEWQIDLQSMSKFLFTDHLLTVNKMGESNLFLLLLFLKLFTDYKPWILC